MFCKYCGKEIKDEAVFCPYCGENLKTSGAEPNQNKRADTESGKRFTGFTYRNPDMKDNEQEAGTAGGTGTSKSDMNRFANMSRRSAQAGKAGSDQPFDSEESVRRIFGGNVFLVLTILLSLYVLLRLLGSKSGLTFILTIPAAFVCIGCWRVFVSCRGNRLNEAGLMMISGGLFVQMVCFVVEGVVLFCLSSYSFYANFLVKVGQLLDAFSFLNVSSGDLYSDVLPIVVFLAILLIIIGGIICIALNQIRAGVLTARAALTGQNIPKRLVFRVRATSGYVVAAIVCYIIRMLYSSRIHDFFYLMFHPYKAIGNGIMTNLFGGSGSSLFNAIVQVMNQVTGSGELDELKTFFLRSMSTNGAVNIAGVLLIIVLICVLILLRRMRENVRAD